MIKKEKVGQFYYFHNWVFPYSVSLNPQKMMKMMKRQDDNDDEPSGT